MEVGHEVLHALGVDADEVGDLARPAAGMSFLEGEEERLVVDRDDEGGSDSEAGGVTLVKVVTEAVVLRFGITYHMRHSLLDIFIL